MNSQVSATLADCKRFHLSPVYLTPLVLHSKGLLVLLDLPLSFPSSTPSKDMASRESWSHPALLNQGPQAPGIRQQEECLGFWGPFHNPVS